MLPDRGRKRQRWSAWALERCCSAVGRRAVLAHATVWTGLRAVMLSDISQFPKDEPQVFTLSP